MTTNLRQRSRTIDRRDMLKLLGGMAVSAAVFIVSRKVRSAPKYLTITGYGSGKYGAGKYGVTADRYSIYMAVMNKNTAP